MSQEQLQQKYLQLQLLEQQIKQVQQQILVLEQQILEFKAVGESLNNISQTKNNTPLYSPLGLGMFIKTELKDNKEILMNVGSKVVVKKTIQGARGLIENKAVEIEEIIKNLQNQLSNEIMIATNLNKEIETLTSKSKKK